MTPEGRVKAAVKRILDDYVEHYREMPVPGGYGKSGLDFTVCFFGRFLSIETKAPGETPTPRQENTMRDIVRAGGVAVSVDGTDDPKNPETMISMTAFRALLASMASFPT